MVRICCKGRGTAQEQVFWTGLPGSRHEWDPAPVFRSDSNGHRKKRQNPNFSFSASSGRDPSPTEVRGCFAAIPSECRSVFLSLFPYQLCLASLPPPGFPSPAGVCRGQCPRPRAGLHHPSRALLRVCTAAGNKPVSSKQPPDSPPTSAGITGSRSGASDGKRPPAPQLPGRSYLGALRSQPAPLNSFYYYSHFTNYLIAAIYLRLSRSDTHRCSRPRSHPRRPTL